MRKLNLSKYERAVEDFKQEQLKSSNLKCNFALLYFAIVPTVFTEKIIENKRSIH